MTDRLLTQVTTALQGHPDDVVRDLGVGGLRLFRQTARTGLDSMLYDPLLCLVVQGAKEVSAGSHAVTCRAGEMIVVSHALPVVSRITQASEELPYVAVILPLDLALLRQVAQRAPPQSDLAPSSEMAKHAAALSVVPVPADVAAALQRLAASATDPRARDVLAPILLQEVHARLVLSPIGGTLLGQVQGSENAGQITRAIARIRASVATPVSVPDLADQAGMSRSSFHAHFKAVTGQSPAQYQKDIRLLQAHAQVQRGDRSMAEIAFDVGYESPAHFSRDFTRKFGMPPRQCRQEVRARASA